MVIETDASHEISVPVKYCNTLSIHTFWGKTVLIVLLSQVLFRLQVDTVLSSSKHLDFDAWSTPGISGLQWAACVAA